MIIDSWINFKDVNWDNPDFNRFHIDTRDFHVLSVNSEKENPTVTKGFLFTTEELNNLILRLFEESEGEGEWRMLDLRCNDPKVLNWNLKYIRIIRTEKGFIICNKDKRPIVKHTWAYPVDTRYLYHH